MVDYANESVEKDGRFVSAFMYQYQNGKLVGYQPEDTLVAKKLEIFGKRRIAEDYASQKDLLDKIHDAKGIDVFVGSCTVAEKKSDGTLFTFSTWTKGVDTLLLLRIA